jgi:archaellum biogenesis ATPase FlaH
VSELIKGLLPRGRTSIVAGSSGAGKTTILLQLIKASQANSKWLDKFVVNPTLRVGFFSTDRSREDLEDTSRFVGVDLSRVEVTSLVSDRTIDLGRWSDNPLAFLLETLEARYAEQDLVIVDVGGHMLGCDLNKYHLVAPRMVKLNRWAEDRGVAVILTSHTNKLRQGQGTLRAEDRVSGSMALTGFTSSHITLQLPEELAGPNGEPAAFHRLRINRRTEAPIELDLTRSSSGLLIPVPIPWRKVLELPHGSVLLKVLRQLPVDGTPMPRFMLNDALKGEVSERSISRYLEQLAEADLIRGKDGQWWLADPYGLDDVSEAA